MTSQQLQQRTREIAVRDGITIEQARVKAEREAAQVAEARARELAPVSRSNKAFSLWKS